MDYVTELSEYATVAYVEYIGDMIKLITERGIEAAVSVLAKVKKSYGPLTSPFQTTKLELPEASCTVGNGQEIGS